MTVRGMKVSGTDVKQKNTPHATGWAGAALPACHRCPVCESVLQDRSRSSRSLTRIGLDARCRSGIDRDLPRHELVLTVAVQLALCLLSRRAVEQHLEQPDTHVLDGCRPVDDFAAV